jgi:hypothetical protein
MGQPIIFSQVLAASNSTAIATSQSPGAGLIAINTTAGVVLDAQRRVLITSGGNDSGINFTVVGLNQFGYPITDTFAGANGTSQSNLDFKTVTGISHTGTVASTLTAGTSGVGSSAWQIINWNVTPTDLTISVELRSGTANFTVEHTYDDPNILPGTGGLNASGLDYALPWPDATISGASATIETSYQIPILAFRLTTNSGTGTLVCRAIQSGLGSP